MGIRSSLLALLDEGDSYGFALKRGFEERTGGTWPVNIGQIYTTLARLERDGLVESTGHDADGHAGFRITDAGRDEARAWWRTPVRDEQAPRDELAIKLALAMTSPTVDVGALMQTQRTATLHRLQELTRMKTVPGGDPAWLLVLDRMIFAVEAELRWLDHCEQRVLRTHRSHTGPPPATQSLPVALEAGSHSPTPRGNR